MEERYLVSISCDADIDGYSCCADTESFNELEEAIVTAKRYKMLSYLNVTLYDKLLKEDIDINEA